MIRLADIKKYMVFGLGVGALALGTSMANAAPVTVDLCTGTTIFDPAGANVPMWGFGTDTGLGCNVTVPGPPISVNEGDVVTINLTNNLPVPVSLIVTGHNVDDDNNPATGPNPVFAPDVNGVNRVQSLVAEAAASDGVTPGTATYIVTAKAGSFIYHSATHQQVQVQMGLYGAMSAAPLASTYDNAIIMFYSEIDPDLHAAVADGSYGTTGPMSTIDYKPRYFLVNGSPDDGSEPVDAGIAGNINMVRMFNAGLRSRTIQLLGSYMSIVAENGAPTPYAKTRHTVDVHALGTADVTINSTTAGNYRLYDRRLAHSDGTSTSPGGITSTLNIAEGTPTNHAPVANDDSGVIVEGATSINLAVLDNDSDIDGDTLSVASVDTTATSGTAAINADGVTIDYTPAAGAVTGDVDSFTYVTSDGVFPSASATVTITVISAVPANTSPVANNDAYEVVEGTATINLAVLSNDTDIDGDVLSVASVDATGSSGTAAINADGVTIDYTPAAGAVAGDVDSFTYVAADTNGGISTAATVYITITAPVLTNIAPVANDETVTYSRAAGAFVDPVTGAITGTTIDVLANDIDPDGDGLDPASVVLSATAKQNTILVDVDGDGIADRERGSSVQLDTTTGEVSYTPPISGLGTDVFTYSVADILGAVSNLATVRVNLVK